MRLRWAEREKGGGGQGGGRQIGFYLRGGG